MDAPAISTLAEEPTPPPSSPNVHISRFRVEPPGEPQPTDRASGRSRTEGDTSVNQEVYVLGDDEEDQLIDEEETGAVPPATLPRSTPAPSVPTPATSVVGTPAAGRQKKSAKSVNPSSTSATTAPKRGRKTKATLEVERQEDPSMSMMSAWRVEVPGGPTPVTPAPEESAQTSKPGPKRKRPSTKGETNPPAVVGSAAPARKRVRKSAAKTEENTAKDDSSQFSIQVSAFPEPSYVPAQIDPQSHQPLTYPPHVQCFIKPDSGVLDDVAKSALVSAPLHSIPLHTSAVQPASTLPWQAYSGPLEREGKHCRRWYMKRREIKTISGASLFTKTWIGDQATALQYVRPPPPPLVVDINPKVVTPATAAKSRKPKTNKDASNVKPPITSAPTIATKTAGENGMVDAAMELEMLAG
ncbi:hypothetical protein FRC02_000145 [Tulasnella sp. 418]|nr:hypothetical protein FRC02_000145 [Tulasnella sp. 418]